MARENDENKRKNSRRDRIFNAIRELSPTGPFEYGPKILPIPRIAARAIVEEPDSQTNPDTLLPEHKEETGQREPNVDQDQDKNVNNDKDSSSDNTEKLPG